MATERLRVILEMVTADYKKGAKDAARATDGITKSGKAADGALAGMRNRLNNIGPGAAAGIIAAGGAIAVQAGKAIKALDDLGIQADNIRNKFAVVFGDGADEVADWADEVNERFGLSQVAVQDLAANFADLLVPIGFTREEASGLTTDALTLANALSEWSGGQISVADATDRVRKALLGEREGLKALNVSILQSDLNARLAANGQSNLTGELKAQAEAQATLEIITEKSADAIAAYEGNMNQALIAQKNFNAATADGQQALADFVNKEVDDFRGVLPVLALLLQDVTEELNGLEEAAGDAEGPTTGLTVGLLRSIPAVEGLREAFQPLIDSYIDSKFVQEDSADATEAYSARLQGQADAVEVLADETNEAALASKRLADETVNTASVLKAQADPLFKAIRAYQNLVDVQEDIAEGGVTLEEQITELAPAFLESKEAIEDLGDGNLERGIEVIAAAVGVAADDVRAFIRELGLLDQIGSIDLAIRVSAERASSGILDPSIAAAARRAGIADKAYGGPVSAGRSYMVGERGPEFFTPTSSGRISSGPLGDAGGGVTINLNVTTQPGFSNQVVREMEQALARYRAGVS